DESSAPAAAWVPTSVAVARWGSALSQESVPRLLQLRNLAQPFAPAGVTPLPRSQSTNSVSVAFHPVAPFGPVLCPLQFRRATYRKGKVRSKFIGAAQECAMLRSAVCRGMIHPQKQDNHRGAVPRSPSRR